MTTTQFSRQQLALEAMKAILTTESLGHYYESQLLIKRCFAFADEFNRVAVADKGVAKVS